MNYALILGAELSQHRAELRAASGVHLHVDVLLGYPRPQAVYLLQRVLIASHVSQPFIVIVFDYGECV